MKFVIREIQNAQSYRAGETIEACDLRAAKIAASKRQMFQGTVLVIEDVHEYRLAVKEDGKWHNVEGQ